MASEITADERHELKERARTDTHELANLIAMAGDHWKFENAYLGQIVVNYLPALKRNLETLRAAAPEENNMTPPAGYTLIDTELFQTISKLLTPEQNKAISEAEARRYFPPVLVGDPREEKK